MVVEPNSSIALMSIHPIFVERIISGEKKVEFRKKGFARNVSYLVIYSTNPVKKIVGFAKVANVVNSEPDDLWNKYESVAGVDINFYNDYFSSVACGVAIELGEVYLLDNPINISELNKKFIAPQSFRYISNEEFLSLGLLAS